MNNTISVHHTIKDALKIMNQFSSKQPLILFILNDNNILIGSLTDGDIRRGLVRGITISQPVTEVMQTNFKYVTNLNDYESINEFKKLDLKIIPVVTSNFNIINFLDLKKLKAVLPIDVVIMAGGKGVRLKPYTNKTPKPLLELNGKPIIAHNVDRLIAYGVKNIYISVNHLKEQIIHYFNKNYPDDNIKFIEETAPLGTIGSVTLASNYENNDILIMNADILTNIDFYDFYSNYKKNNDSMSIATFNVRINVPFAVLDISDRLITSFVEKPSYTYYSNAGIYLVQKKMFNYIPLNEKFDSTDLMEILIKKKKSVSHFLIRGYWLDIGNAENYAKAQDDIKFIKF